jgi:hypothetical protein
MRHGFLVARSVRKKPFQVWHFLVELELLGEGERKTFCFVGIAMEEDERRGAAGRVIERLEDVGRLLSHFCEIRLLPLKEARGMYYIFVKSEAENSRPQ